LEAAGWRSVASDTGFNSLVGPFWLHDTEGAGLLIGERHCNPHLGTLHGGIVMTFADIALGIGAAGVLGEQRTSTVTASMNTQFVAVAHVGEFLVCRPEVVRQSRHLVFVRGLICSGERTIASADGIFKVLEPRTAAEKKG
jgi:acyl-coenzyme A thioesterase PaaI-like protein